MQRSRPEGEMNGGEANKDCSELFKNQGKRIEQMVVKGLEGL